MLDVLADGYNVKYGARSLKHEVHLYILGAILGVHYQNTMGCMVAHKSHPPVLIGVKIIVYLSN